MISQAKLRLSKRTLDAWVPPRRISSWDWICEHAANKRGEPWDPYAYPWTEGICDAWDDPDVERIFFQAGSRLGKTELGLALLKCSMAIDPDIGMIGGPSADKIEQWFIDRLIPMIRHCGPMRNWLPPTHRQRKHILRLLHGTIYGAWSGSPTTLGDLDPRYLMAFEIDKFSKNSSEEADSLMLLMERGAEIPDRRFYGESTPTVFGKSRIHHYVRQGWNCKFHVPCPKCGRFQPLELGRGKPGDHGLIWDHNDQGHSEPNLAYATARYRCKFCSREIPEEKRLGMVQDGKWCPQGCMIDKLGRRRGVMANAGPDASYQIGRLYGASFTFQRYARAFVEAKNSDDSEALRSFKNNWAGLCWSPHYSQKPWEEVAERLCAEDVELGKAPVDAQFITMGVDVQIDHWVYVICSWTSGARGSVVGYGQCHSWDQLKGILGCQLQHADGGPPLPIIYTLIDARDGNRTDEVTAFCRTVNSETGPWVLPCMGSKPGTLSGKPYSKQQLDATGKLTKVTRRRGITGFELVTVNTNYYQQWIHNSLDRRSREDTSSVIFPMSARYDEDLFAQLLSEVPQWDNDKCLFVKKTQDTINDLRDSLRYARCAADVYVSQNWQRVVSRRVLRQTSAGAVEQKQAPQRRQAAPKPDKPRFVRRMKIAKR